MRTTGSAIRLMTVDDLSERIRVVYFEASRNARGDIVKSEEIVRCTIWAKVLPLTGRVNDTTPERANTVTYRVTVRYRTDIQPDDEIIWRGRRLKLTAPPIDLDTRHIWTQFDCQEVIQDGEKEKEIYQQ